MIMRTKNNMHYVGIIFLIIALLLILCSPLQVVLKVIAELLLIFSSIYYFLLTKSLKSERESCSRLSQEVKQKDEIIKTNYDNIQNLKAEIESQTKKINQQKQEIEKNAFPLENRYKPLLELLNDVYLECDEYGEEYATHLKKRLLFNLKNAGYKYIDYNDENIDYYSAFNSNYLEDIVTQPALINTKTKKCIIRGMVFYKGISEDQTK